MNRCLGHRRIETIYTPTLAPAVLLGAGDGAEDDSVDGEAAPVITSALAAAPRCDSPASAAEDVTRSPSMV